jgi:predicted DNA-binding protein
MTQKYTKILVAKLSPSVHDKFKNLAMKERRTLSNLCRIIIEDYINGFNISNKEEIDDNA